MVDHSKKVVNPPPSPQPPKYPDVLPAPIIMENKADKERGGTAATTLPQQQNKTPFRERSVKTDCGDQPFKEQQQTRRVKRQKRENRKR